MLKDGVEVPDEIDELDNDLFGAGFDEILKGEENPAEEKPAEEKPAEEKPAEENPAEEKPVKETPPAPDLKTVIAEVIAATKPEKTEPLVVDIPPEKSAEELAAEEQYRKDWPEHAAREDKLLDKITKLESALTTAVDALKGQITPVAETVNTNAQKAHLEYITSKHADALDIVDDVEKWIDTQPTFLQPAYLAVLDKGSAADVVGLYDLYKKENGIQAIDTAAADADAAAKKAAADRLARMETTKTVRTSVTAEEDPSDYDSAFESEAKKVTQNGQF